MGYSMRYCLQTDIIINNKQVQLKTDKSTPGLTIAPPKPVENNTENVQSDVSGIQQKQLVPYELKDPYADKLDFDIAGILECIKKEIRTISQATSKETTTTAVTPQTTFKKSPQIPIFNKSKIGNINIDIHKN